MHWWLPVFVADSVVMAMRDGLALYGRERLHEGMCSCAIMPRSRPAGKEGQSGQIIVIKNPAI